MLLQLGKDLFKDDIICETEFVLCLRGGRACVCVCG